MSDTEPQTMPERQSATIAEIDHFIAAVGPDLRRCDRDWLAKIRAHAEADELERKRLQAEIMLSAKTGEGPVFTEKVVGHVLDLSSDWRVAPQRARERAHAMPPTRVCGAKLGEDVCRREPNHGGKHCPIGGSEDDHG